MVLELRALAITVALPLVICVAASGVAAAAPDDNPAIGKITLLNREAIEEYKKLNFDEAQRLLDQALDLAANSGLTQHPVRARTYVTLGVVTAGGLKRRDVAVRLFRKALQIQPEIQLSTELATPEIRTAFDEAIQGLGSEPRVDRLPSELLVHDPVTNANRGEPITIAATPDDSVQADRMVLAYRPAGAAQFSKVNMQKQSDGVFEGVISPLATGGEQVTYYIEARNLDGKLVAARGSPVAPMIVVLALVPGSATSSALPPGVAGTPPGPGRPEQRRLVVGLLAGTGMGWASGSGETTDYPVTSSTLAWSKLLHVAPEVGYFVTPQLMLGLVGRFQVVTGATEFKPPDTSPGQCGDDGICSPARGAFAGFAKASWFFTSPDSPFRPYASLAIGAGQIRHVIKLPAANSDCGSTRTQACVDTIAAGPLLVAAAVGFRYQLSPITQLVVDVSPVMGAPDVTFGVDGNLGVAFLF